MRLKEAPPGAVLPRSLLLPFHEVTLIQWDEKTGTGRIEASRRNRFDDWYYDCHFLGDPVMPGCWGVDAVWQCLKYFAAWRGLPPCKPLGMEDVRFFGQIRPHDKRVVYAVDVLSLEESGRDWLVTGRATVHVDGVPVYTIGAAQVGTAFWESADQAAMPAVGEDEPSAPISYGEFTARRRFSHSELVAISRGTLVKDPPPELGLLPSGLMLEIGKVMRIAYDESSGEGLIQAAKENRPEEWHYAMNAGVKPTVLSIDGVWQLLGLFLSWRGYLGTGRALGFERVEVFDDVRPADRQVLYELSITKLAKAQASGDAFARADAKVYADGRPILSCLNANVGCHKGIRYAEYPHHAEMGFGGKVKIRAESAP